MALGQLQQGYNILWTEEKCASSLANTPLHFAEAVIDRIT